jgi:hypothetical protein
MSWSDVLSTVNCAGLVLAVAVVAVTGVVELLLRRW